MSPNNEEWLRYRNEDGEFHSGGSHAAACSTSTSTFQAAMRDEFDCEDGDWFGEPMDMHGVAAVMLDEPAESDESIESDSFCGDSDSPSLLLEERSQQWRQQQAGSYRQRDAHQHQDHDCADSSGRHSHYNVVAAATEQGALLPPGARFADHGTIAYYQDQQQQQQHANRMSMNMVAAIQQRST